LNSEHEYEWLTLRRTRRRGQERVDGSWSGRCLRADRAFGRADRRRRPPAEHGGPASKA